MDRDNDVPRLDWWPDDKADACPDPETLAAFVDNRLDGDERARVSGHVSGCTRCYQAFAGTIDSRPEEEAAGRAHRFPSWLAAAAVLAVLVAGGLFWRAQRPSLPEPGDYLASVSGLIVASNAHPWGVVVFRGPADAHHPSGFEVGVLLVDAQMLAARGDAANARSRLLRLAHLMEAAGFLDREAALCREVSQASPEAIRGYVPRLAELAKGLDRRFDRADLVFGAWAEAGRLAASGQETRFFSDRRQREILRAVRDREAVTPEGAQTLQDVADQWPKGRDAAADWPRLAEAFSRLIEAEAR